MKITITKNLGRLDKICRGGLGALAMYVGLFEASAIGDPMLAMLVAGFGLLNVVSAAAGWCYVYQLAGISTRKAASS